MKIPKYELKLNIKTVMLYEQLTQQSFIRFEDNRIENSIPLLYCMIAANNPDFDITYQDAVNYLFTDDKFVSKMMEKLQKVMDFNNQFGGYGFLFADDTKTEENKHQEKEKRPLFVSELVPSLIKDCGLSVEYVLNDMPINTDILFLHYRDELRKAEMENKRLFTYATISPHINTKKTPYSKFMRFEWETEKRKRNAVNYLNNKENIKKMKDFLNSKPLTDEK